MDEIFITDLIVQTVIGVYEWERKNPQDILINIRMFTDSRKAAQTDNIEDCIDYGEMARKIQAHAENSTRFTVESFAEDIANLCLEHQLVKKVNVRVEKVGVVKGTSSVGLQIERNLKKFS